ncbi:general secretion pathway protein N [Sphaerotilus hippei]|uniref:Type II secretion system protein N n=1 Tax=Sphaerotilus hippei TaxID=744406 RepID=A0A318H1V4_9BURK|nr:type II secretion system protein N [Sphaerotilus hippei]PXW97104.1 general secretion pathway protein N [Sphaerotilus hippei]
MPLLPRARRPPRPELRLPATVRAPRPAGRPSSGLDPWAAELARVRRWAVGGLLTGALVALIVFAPASWLAAAVAQATQGRVLLADARGTVWTGNAVMVLGGGPGSGDASTLPGRLNWTLRPAGTALRLALQQACCLSGTLALRIAPGLGQVSATLEPGSGDAGWLAQWPAALLTGLGTPWNTVQPGGALRLSSSGLTLQWAAGRFALTGEATLELRDLSSRLTTLERLGSYRLAVRSDASEAGIAQVELTTLDGALRLEARGSWSRSGLRLRGEARAEPDAQGALDNLLNIIGRRDGARSVLTIG